MTVEIDIDDYFYALDKMREERDKSGVDIPDEVYKFLKQTMQEQGVPQDSLATIIDNVFYNGFWCSFDDYRYYNPSVETLSDEQIKQSIKDEVLGFNNDYVITSLWYYDK